MSLGDFQYMGIYLYLLGSLFQYFRVSHNHPDITACTSLLVLFVLSAVCFVTTSFLKDGKGPLD